MSPIAYVNCPTLTAFLPARLTAPYAKTVLVDFPNSYIPRRI